MFRLPRPSLAIWSIIALAAGLALGAIGQASGASGFHLAERVLRPIGDLWLAGLQLLLLPLIGARTRMNGS